MFISAPARWFITSQTHSFRAYALIYYVPITFNCSGLPCRLYLLVRSLIIFWVEIHGRRNIFTVRFLKFNALRLLFKLLTVNIWAENVSFWGRFSYPIFVQYRWIQLLSIVINVRILGSVFGVSAPDKTLSVGLSRYWKSELGRQPHETVPMRRWPCDGDHATETMWSRPWDGFLPMRRRPYPMGWCEYTL